MQSIPFFMHRFTLATRSLLTVLIFLISLSYRKQLIASTLSHKSCSQSLLLTKCLVNCFAIVLWCASISLCHLPALQSPVPFVIPLCVCALCLCLLCDVCVSPWCKNAMTETRSCRLSQFRCGTGYCIDRYLLCNGIVDCPDAADEMDCCNKSWLTPTKANLVNASLTFA